MIVWFHGDAFWMPYVIFNTMAKAALLECTEAVNDSAYPEADESHLAKIKLLQS